MFHNGGTSPSSQSSLRRRYQALKEDQRRNGSLSSGRSSSDGGLELSMHLPPRAYSNRFDVLRPPSPPPKPEGESQISPSYRRLRHGRGSKAAKRRRDARRNRRKLQAVQMLDQQFSRDVDKTLTQANISPHRRYNVSNPTPASPPTSIPTPQPARVPSAPPQLPVLNFGGLDLVGEGMPFTPNRVDSGYCTPSLLTPTLPSWCPKLPSLSGKRINWSEFPLFFDLSELPEPVYVPNNGSHGREVQLWRPPASQQPKKQSRFFPPPASPKPNVKLPPTSCKLHADDKGVETSVLKPRTVAESLEQVVKAAETARRARCDEESEKSAANLWKILTSSEHPIRGDDNDLYPRNCCYQPLDDMYVAPNSTYDHRLESVGLPVELDSTEIPYVHANSLTGHANERGSEAFPASEEDVTLCEKPANPARIEEFLGGLNEMMMDPYADDGYTDALLAVLNLPPLLQSPDQEDAAPITTDPRPADSVVITNNNSANEFARSDAHFSSEQALFHPQPLAPRTPEEDLVDVATFLTMGHSENCWCNDCGEPPALSSDEMLTEDDGWIVYYYDDMWAPMSQPTMPGEDMCAALSHSTTPSTSSAWEWEWGTVVIDEEQVVERAPPPYQPTWDEIFPYKPSCLAHRAW